MKMIVEKQIINPTLNFFPAPVVLLSCGTLENANIITLAWSGVMCSKPPIISASIRPQRYSYHLVVELQEFVINIPTADQLEAANICGTKSGKDIDKWKECSFTPVKAEKVSVPLILECLINIECKVIRTIDIGTHTIFFGEVLCVHKPLNFKSAIESNPLAFSAGKYGKMILI
ncbi:MAG: flavin reductase family protein [Candidatus Hodarchaeales archaeon]|jgi:flavin reductase (DIM6/NTAB) family NADH-FMN oxidoreductase RutF